MQAHAHSPSAPPPVAPHDSDAARAGFAQQGHNSMMTRDLDQDSAAQVRSGMVELGVPAGLAKVLAEEDQRVGLRIYLLDNSGSMNAADGCILQEMQGGRVQPRDCTRWEEICQFARDHARWNLATGVPAQFMLLNSSGGGADHSASVRVQRSNGSSIDDLDKLLRNNPPRGGTPITARLLEIGHLIQQECHALASKGQMVFLTLATDGLPTTVQGQNDSDAMIQEIKRMVNSLPVQMVIRLCTHDAQVVQFYNRIDEDYELPLDIIDDYQGEAQQIALVGNDFFVYTPTLHRIREAGTLSKLLDSIDEQRLAPVEVRRLVELLSTDDNLSRCPDNKAFVAQVRQLVRRERVMFDPVSGQMKPYVNVRSIKRSLRVGFRVNLFPCIY